MSHTDRRCRVLVTMETTERKEILSRSLKTSATKDMNQNGEFCTQPSL